MALYHHLLEIGKLESSENEDFLQWFDLPLPWKIPIMINSESTHWVFRDTNVSGVLFFGINCIWNLLSRYSLVLQAYGHFHIVLFL